MAAPLLSQLLNAAPRMTSDRKGTVMDFTIPKALEAEHKELHGELVKLTKLSGEVGEAARQVAALLHPHFVKEEEYALPPLGLLTVLAEGRVIPEMIKVIELTDRLRADLPHMLDEHRTVVAALRRLAAAAKKERNPAAAVFAAKLQLHAETEEQVLYPAAILIGEYVKARLGPVGSAEKGAGVALNTRGERR